jgi:hypothetical protein
MDTTTEPRRAKGCGCLQALGGLLIGMLAFGVQTVLGIPFFLSLPLTIILLAVAGVWLQRVRERRALRKTPPA